MPGVKEWTRGFADRAAGVAKRAVGELTARPDLVIAGEIQQARGQAQAASVVPGEDWVAGWKLDRRQRTELLGRLPPRHAFVVADHVTLQGGLTHECHAPPPCRAAIVGRADDGSGVEAMVVTIDGTTDRPDGGTYHVTWSLGPGRHARESNTVIARLGWKAMAEPIPIEVHPAIFR